MLAVMALLIALLRTLWAGISAQVLIGGTSSILGPAICAVSLGIVDAKHSIRDKVAIGHSLAGNVAGAVSMASSATSFPPEHFLLSVGLRHRVAAFGILYLFMPETLDRRFLNPQ